MLFNSWTFVCFFPIALGLYWALPRHLRWVWLLATSCAFYMAFVPAYVLILFAVIAIDYAAGLAIAQARDGTRRRWLLVSVVANLALLGFFKYFNFFADNVRAAAALAGWNLPLPVLQVLLPIGLSFHVFQSLSYTIEVFRGHQAPERNLGIYAVYVMFWPQLVAGPIERPQNLLPQFHQLPELDYGRLGSGLRLMAWGFFQKVVVADRLALLVNPVFAHPKDHHGLTLVLAATFFSFQIYGDFAGYSNIARGAARTMGIELMTNFRDPYFARTIRGFWTRWHISLSTWFRDYVYIPLGGNRSGRARQGRNLLVVFILSGLWHGANWTYVAWGALHGTYLVTGLWLQPWRARVAARVGAERWPTALAAAQILSTFGLVTFAWVFFRCDSLADAWTFLSRVPVGLAAHLSSYRDLREALVALDPDLRNLKVGVGVLAALLAVSALHAREPLPCRLARRPRWVRLLAYEALLLAILFLGVFRDTTFIYFQF